MFSSTKTPVGVKNIINSITTSWYQENLSRRDAEDQLLGHCNGTFVFRPNTSIPAWYYSADKILSLSLRTPLGVKHFIIIFKNKMWYIGGVGKKFDRFGNMLIYYSKKYPSKTYKTKLIKALPVYNIYEK